MNINNNQYYSSTYTNYQSDQSDQSDSDSSNHHLANVENEDLASEFSDWSDDDAPQTGQINTLAIGQAQNAPYLQMQQLILQPQPLNPPQDNHHLIGGLLQLGNIPQQQPAQPIQPQNPFMFGIPPQLENQQASINLSHFLQIP